MKDKKSTELANLIKDETFDMDPEEIRQLGYHTVDLIVDYLNNICKGPILTTSTLKQMKELLYEPLPQTEQDPTTILDDCRKKIIANAIRIGNPRFLGWILASGTVIGAFADGIASTLNQNVAVSGAGMATALELLVIDWIKEILGYDPKAAGILLSGGSMANLTALAAARNVKADFEVGIEGIQQGKNMILYVSEEVHSCVPKAANILGIGMNNIRRVRVDDAFRLDTNDLKAKIIEDKNRGMLPFCVVATAGTVNTGAIDPLEPIADICQQYNLWFHVDAAYGGFAILSSNLKPLLNGIARADSIALDPHKWLFIPFEAGCVLVKNPSHMIQTFSVNAPYIHLTKTKPISSEGVDFSDYGLQLSRQFRALKIWMSLKQYGIQKYGRLIDQNVYLARYMAALVDESPDFEVASHVTLSIFCFRYLPEDLQQKYRGADQLQKEKIEEYLNRLNHLIAEDMLLDQRAVLSSTFLGSTFVLRVCIVNYRTKKQDIKDILTTIRELGHIADKRLRRKKLR
ncbi:MAG: aminotransferase class I/II-fold pyridoxal phosphate-dependent enzyme [Thermoplasmatales archaeon]|nr:MAG: aminotransferase class I/II-fold pyridoxal phosphate-dependent enzyme [Thermoplasmatales archaeon]